MSKSLGNVFSLPDIVAKGYDALDLRYYLLSVHYRTRLKFTWKGMEDSKIARRKIVEWIDVLKRVMREEKVTGKSDDAPTIAVQSFKDAMNSDLNTPAALGTVFSLMNHYYAHAPFDAATQMRFIDFAEMIRHTFGCFEPAVSESIPVEVQSLLDARATARARKDFAESDRLRMEIEQRGYEVRDSKGKQEVKKM